MSIPNCCFKIVGACIAVLANTALAAPLNHLGQPTTQHVTLIYLSDLNTTCPSAVAQGIQKRSFYRVWPSGDLAPHRFVVPGGKELVVTDISWKAPYFLTGTQPQVGEGLLLKLAIHRSIGAHRIIVYESEPVTITAENQSARIGTNDSLTAGFRVGPGRILCASLSGQAAGVDAGTVDTSVIFLNGYLIDRI